MFKSKYVIAGSLLLAMVGSVAACGDNGEADTVHLTFAVPDQSMSATTASYASVPEELGYFSDRGLAVKMQPVESAIAAIQAVGAGQADCTYASTANAFVTRAQDDSITLLGATSGNIFRVVAPASSGITTMEDLKGKTIGASTQGAISVDLAKGGMRSAGVEPSDDQFLAVGYGSQAAQAFINGDIDAYSGFDGPNLVIEGLLGEDLVDVESAANSLTGTSTFVCETSLVEENPEAVADLWAAFFEGLIFAQENPEAAVDIHWKHFPAAKPGGDDASALQGASAQLSLRAETTGKPNDEGVFGVQSEEDIENLRSFYGENDIIGSDAVELPFEDLFDFSLVDAYNDFDKDGVVSDAASWTSD